MRVMYYCPVTLLPRMVSMLLWKEYMQHMYVDQALPCGLQVGHKFDVNLSSLDLVVQGNVLLTFTPEATGVSWPAYVHLYCAGAKQLFFHEKPKMPLQLEPVTLSSL